MKVRILTPALREIVAALEYYEGQASGLASALDADVLLGEIEEEHQWDTALGETQDELAGLADAALSEYRTGETRALDPDAP